MAGKRKRVAEKDYESLINASKQKIAKLSEELKSEKTNLKQLEKDAVRYEEQKAIEEREREMSEIAELISGSDKSLDEIKAFLQGDESEKETSDKK